MTAERPREPGRIRTLLHAAHTTTVGRMFADMYAIVPPLARRKLRTTSPRTTVVALIDWAREPSRG